VDSDERLSARVAADPFGIGFIGFGDTGDAKPLAISGACGLRVSPSEFAIKSEQYPLTRRLSAYVAGQRPDQLSGFFEFLNTQAAQTAVADAGFITQDVTAAPLNDVSERLSSAILSGLTPEALPRLQDMVRNMKDASQLSLSFRFVPGTNSLDARSHADMERLAQLLASDAYAAKVVTLASFTEAAANAAQNQPLSVQRGQMILDGLLAIDPSLEDKVTLNMVGYGDIAPLTCSGTVVGQHVNSRVEVWVKDAVNNG
jgi:phosphate transport system substrate-binding protein